MKKYIGWSLLATACLILLGMILANQIYWFIIDIVMILVCAGSGSILILSKKPLE